MVMTNPEGDRDREGTTRPDDAIQNPARTLLRLTQGILGALGRHGDEWSG